MTAAVEEEALSRRMRAGLEAAFAKIKQASYGTQLHHELNAARTSLHAHADQPSLCAALPLRCPCTALALPLHCPCTARALPVHCPCTGSVCSKEAHEYARKLMLLNGLRSWYLAAEEHLYLRSATARPHPPSFEPFGPHPLLPPAHVHTACPPPICPNCLPAHLSPDTG
jgi:hypothetical protein